MGLSDTAGVIRPVAPPALLSRCCHTMCAHSRRMCAQQGGGYLVICACGGLCYRAAPCSLSSRYTYRKDIKDFMAFAGLRQVVYL
jgi:hypothetical protein